MKVTPQASSKSAQRFHYRGAVLAAVACMSILLSACNSAPNAMRASDKETVLELCIIADEHISNRLEISQKLKALGYSISACEGIKAPANYDHMSKAKYKHMVDASKRADVLSSYGSQDLRERSSVELCGMRNTISPNTFLWSSLQTVLAERALSPAECDLQLKQYTAQLCGNSVTATSDMDFRAIQEINAKNANIEAALDAIGESTSSCEKLEAERAAEIARLERSEAQASEKRREAQITRDIYNVDLLRVSTISDAGDSRCSSGAVHHIGIEGVIGPDSTFAIESLLDRFESCKDERGSVAVPVTVYLASGGGLLQDGYALGRLLRSANAKTVVRSGEICASSCAVAFLGGRSRSIEDDARILFHAPYFSGRNEYGKRDVNCDVGQDALDELKTYYRNVTDTKTGARLFERTMWYCSADDGWVVTGGAAAELFGIATER